MKEVAILQELDGCPNIIRLIGVCVNPRHYALIMEYIENGDLEELLLYKQEDHPSVKQWDCRIRMGLDVARGMDFLHQQQPPIMHGDLKSANVLVDTNYSCKIIDFGLSKARGISSCSSALPQCSHQNAAGTLAFVAPERFKGESGLRHPDKADVYSFSIILWQLKEMRGPYEGESSSATVRENVVAGIRPSLSHDDCPVDMKELISRCWKPQAQFRPSFSETVVTLERIVTSYSSSQHSIVQQPNSSVESKTVFVTPSSSVKVMPSSTLTSSSVPGESSASYSARRPSLLATPRPWDTLSLVSKFAEHKSAATHAGMSGSDDDIEAIAVPPPSKRKRLSYSNDSRKVQNFAVQVEAGKWKRWPSLPVTGSFYNRCVTIGNEVVVADAQNLYSLNTSLCSLGLEPNWKVKTHCLQDRIVLHSLFTASGRSFGTFYSNSDRKLGVAQFDLYESNRWMHAFDLPVYHHYGIVGYGRYAYIIGGGDQIGYVIYDDVLKYDLSTGQLCERGKLMSKRRGCSSVLRYNTLYVGGGSDGQTYLNSVETVSLRNCNSFKSLSPTLNYQCSLSTCSDDLIATGGLDDAFSVSNMSSIFSLGTDAMRYQWLPLPAMNEGRRSHGLCEIGSKVVALGGIDKDGSQLDSVEVVEKSTLRLSMENVLATRN